MFEQSSLTGRLPGEAPGSWSEFKAAFTTVCWKLAVLVVVGTWIAFWGLVMRLHLLQGAYVSAGVVGLLFVVPAILGISAYLGPLPDPQRVIPTVPLEHQV